MTVEYDYYTDNPPYVDVLCICFMSLFIIFTFFLQPIYSP